MSTSPQLNRRDVPLAAILLVALTLWGGEYVRRSLWEPDEARYAYVAREMRWTGNWAVPSRHGELYAHKPPLMFWLINAGSLLTGGKITAVSTRLPSLLGAVLSLWAICRLAALWTERRNAWRVLLILPTALLFWHEGGMGQIDALLCGLEMMAIYLLFTSDESPGFARTAGAYLCMGLAILAKGPVGLAVPLGVYACARLAAGEQRLLARWHWLWGTAISLLFPAAWLAAAWQQGATPTYFRELLGQSVTRATTGTGHNAPFYFFFYHFPLDFLPWTIFLPAALIAAPLTPARRRLLGWLGFVIVFFSLFTDKRNLYILLAFPAGALLVADAWDKIAGLPAAWGRWTGRVAIGFLLVLAFALAGASVYPSLPFAPWVLWPGAVLALSGAIAVWRSMRQHGFSPHLLYVFAGAMFWVQVCVGLFVYPALNPLKSPVDLAREAPQLIPPGQEILLYGAKAEIMALYAERPGRNIFDVGTLMKEIKRQEKGVAVFPKEDWDEFGRHLRVHAVPHVFSMGHKKFVWIEFDTRITAQPPGAQNQ